MQSTVPASKLNLKGGAMPLSPTGKMSAYNNVPVKIGGRAMIITFRPNAKEARKYVPWPLEMDEPLGILKVYSLVRSPVDEDLKSSNPERTQYNEVSLGLAANYQGQKAVYSAVLWVDQEDALIRGREVYGIPKKLGKVTMTKFLPHEKFGPGSEVSGLLERHSNRIVTAKTRIERQVEPKALPSWGNFYYLRYIASPDPTIPDIRQLTSLNVEDVKTSDVWEGEATLKFGDSPNEELLPLQPEEVLKGYYFNLSWKLPIHGKVVLSY
jgi:acetoacetate decarboxylase